jgi:CheY-like chemotaxis protein
MMASGKFRFDMILMDIQMPVMDGVQAMKEIRKLFDEKKTEKIPIIALTADNDKAHVKSYIDSGMDECLHKPLNEAALRTIIEKYLNN